MLGFLDLPPELRDIIYDFLLAALNDNKKRVAYIIRTQTKPGGSVRTTEWIRVKQEYEVSDRGLIKFRPRLDYSRDASRAKHIIHHNDIDDLFALASTHSKVRSEVLPLVWPNANIILTASNKHLPSDLDTIFKHSLTAESCNLVTALQFDVGRSDWQPCKTKAMSQFLSNQLPKLKIVMVYVARTGRPEPKQIFGGIKSLAHMRADVWVEFMSYLTCHPTDVVDFGALERDPAVAEFVASYFRHVEHSTTRMYNTLFQWSKTILAGRSILRLQNQSNHASDGILDSTLGVRSMANE